MVVRMVNAKKMACPKLQLGSDIVTLRLADTPLLAAITTSFMNRSNSSSAQIQYIMFFDMAFVE